jgi:aminoglycoside phosphotransferase (APT) family kinase protein
MSKDECISIPRNGLKVDYSVRVAAMQYLSRHSIPTTRLVDYGAVDGIEYVITRRIAAAPPCVVRCSTPDSESMLHACGDVLRRIHLLDASGYGRLDSSLCGPHRSWKGFVEDYFVSSLRRLSKDACLRTKFVRTLEARFGDMLPLIDDVRVAFLHGDYHSGNVLFQGTELKAVIDLDIVMRGDPHWDLAHFVRTCKWGHREARETFLDAYGEPVDEARMRFYAMVIWTRKIASQAESRREALAESVPEMERIVFA